MFFNLLFFNPRVDRFLLGKLSIDRPLIRQTGRIRRPKISAPQNFRERASCDLGVLANVDAVDDLSSRGDWANRLLSELFVVIAADASTQMNRVFIFVDSKKT